MKAYNIDDILDRVDSKYSLCIALARRSRELGLYIAAKKNMERVNIVPPLSENESDDPVGIALQEMREGKVTFERIKDDIK